MICLVLNSMQFDQDNAQLQSVLKSIFSHLSAQHCNGAPFKLCRGSSITFAWGSSITCACSYMKEVDISDSHDC